MENKDKPKQVPKTIENCRIKDETFIGDLQNDPEIQLDLRTDELSTHLLKGLNKAKKSQEEYDQEEAVDGGEEEDDTDKIDQNEYEKKEELEAEDDDTDDDDDDEEEEESDDPKILITTTELKVSFRTYKLCRELSRILPNANYFYRKNVRMSKVIPEAIKRKYSAILAINEDRKEPSMKQAHLRAHFVETLKFGF